MGDHDHWKNLPIELLKLIAWRLKYLVDFTSFTAVCKSWKSAASDENPWLPFGNHPKLLITEDTGDDLSSVKVSYLNVVPMIHNFDASVDNLFSLAIRKFYNLDLPEATDKVILGATKGWLLMLDRDLEINLLHPLLRKQIELPSMLKLLAHDEYNDDIFPRKLHIMFISKVVMSSEVARKCALQHHGTGHLPVIIVIYGMSDKLASARLGDRFWTNVQTSARFFHDIVYHKGKFYAVDCEGTIFMCDINNDDDEGMQYKGTRIASVPCEIKNHAQTYVVESLCGSHIWVLLRFRKRFRKGVVYETCPCNRGDFGYYYTCKFEIFKFEEHYDSDEAIPTYTCTDEVEDLGNEALFIGRGSSISIASSEFIQPNSIYFTDDSEFLCYGKGNHDMGIFNVKTGEIQPHFRGRSIHPFSPPLWYI